MVTKPLHVPFTGSTSAWITKLFERQQNLFLDLRYFLPALLSAVAHSMHPYISNRFDKYLPCTMNSRTSTSEMGPQTERTVFFIVDMR